MFEILPVSAFRDNYIWLLHNGQHATVVDPGDATPVMQALENHALVLDTILITHHHDDHVGGVSKLLEKWPATVYAPNHQSFRFAHVPVTDEMEISLPSLGTRFSVLTIPGHTLEHVAYYGANCIFCGDTLFGAGCGRLFEGTPAQMFDSLQRLAHLPADTQVYCGHEYTEHNLRFALSLEPDNLKLVSRLNETLRLRKQGLPTLPSTIGAELETNPFLRCGEKPLQRALGSTDPLEVFKIARQLRNNY